MSREKLSEELIDRRSFFRRLLTIVGCGSLYLMATRWFFPFSASAEPGVPAPPGFGPSESEGKSVSESVIVMRAIELSNKLDATSEKNNIELTPEQKQAQREEIEKAMREVVKSKGYKIEPPRNLRLVVPPY